MVATILVGMLCAHLLCFSAMFLLISQRLQGNKMGMHYFATGNLLLGLAYVLQLAEGGPAWSAMSVVNHTLALASPIAYWLGAMRFFGQEVPLWRPVVVFSLAYAGAQVLVQWSMGAVARYAMLAAMSATMFFVMAWTVVYGVRTFARDLRWEMFFFALLITGIGVLNAIKFVRLATGGLDMLRMDHTFQMVFYIYMSSLATLLPPAIIWLVLRRLTDELRGMAARDPLTGLLNRRGLAQALEAHFNTRDAAPAYLLLLDVDHFKRINDSHGHQAGDAVLCQVAEVLRRAVRRGDLTGRVGGEEFAAVCLDTDRAGAMQVAERLRAGMESRSMEIPGARAPLRCTATIGISAPFTGTASLDDAMRQADAALYRGKDAGRNRIEASARQAGVPAPDGGP
ncbi:GGDEF domain-containing protein [Comamonas antarctica]|uniref:GGDEF domain-containing protein n=1 Tax=Comamonas antarctica TaxID=2743470 RepID=UPI0028E4D23A|nr:GGDEF domain-containing protein [Comamonas antarctica]